MLLWIEEIFSIWYDTGGTLKTEPEDEVENSERVGNREVCDQTQEDLRGNGKLLDDSFLEEFLCSLEHHLERKVLLRRWEKDVKLGMVALYGTEMITNCSNSPLFHRCQVRHIEKQCFSLSRKRF